MLRNTYNLEGLGELSYLKISPAHLKIDFFKNFNLYVFIFNCKQKRLIDCS
jgi:hypothetical protein